MEVVAVVDEQRVVSGGTDGRVRVWDLCRPGEPVASVAYTVIGLDAYHRNDSATTTLAISGRGLSNATVACRPRLAHDKRDTYP